MSPETSTTVCASCQKPSKKFCSSCKDHPNSHGLVGSVYYCSVDCQKTHWKTHKKDCNFRKDRLVLFRMASTLQEIFYIYREHLYDKPIVKVEERDSKIYVTEGKPNLQALTSHDYIVPLPEGIFKNQTREIKQATLVQLACTDIFWMDDIIKLFLKDVVTDIREYTVLIGKIKKRMITIDNQGGEHDEYVEYEHEIFQVSMKDGLSYALDFTGAQYGYFEPLINWDDYCKERVKEPVSTNGSGQYFGHRKQRWEKEVMGGKSTVALIGHNNQEACQCLKYTAEAYEKMPGLTTILEMCKQPEKEFIARQKVLFQLVAIGLKGDLEQTSQLYERDLDERGGRKQILRNLNEN